MSRGRGFVVFLLDGLEEVALLGLVAVLEEISDVLTHTGCRNQLAGPSWAAGEGEECLPTVILDILTVFQ